MKRLNKHERDHTIVNHAIGKIQETFGEGKLANSTDNIATTGTNTETTVGTVLLKSGTASGTSLDIPLIDYTAYRSIEFHIGNLLPTLDVVELHVRFATDAAGTSFDAGAGNYSYHGRTITQGGTAGSQTSTSDTKISIASGGFPIGNATTEGWSGTVTLYNHTSTALWPRLFYTGVYIDSEATPGGVSIQGGGERRAAQDTTGVRFLFSSGDIASGTYAVYGYL